MKKIFTFIIILLFLVSLVSAQFSANQFAGNNPVGDNSGSSDDAPPVAKLSFGAKIFAVFGLGGGSDDGDDGPLNDIPTKANPNPSGDGTTEGDEGTGKIKVGQGIYGVFDWKPSDNIVAVTCSDTDNGRDFSKSGIVKGKIGPDSEAKDYPDRCMPSGNMLVETYCNRWTGYVQFNRITCKNGCIETSEGAKCPVPPFCLDTDRDSNRFVRGSVILFKSASSTIPLGSVAELIADDSIEIIQDVCSSETTVKQFACSGSSIGDYIYNELECDEKQKCMAGICKDMVQYAGNEGGETAPSKVGILGYGNEPSSPSTITDRKKTIDSQGGSIEIMDGQSATVNGVLVLFSSNSNSIQFAQQFSEGVHNIEGNEIEIGGETSIDKTSIDAPLKTVSTSSTSIASSTSTIKEETTTPKTISSTSTLSSPISVSTLRL